MALPPNTAAPGNMTTPYNIDNVHPYYNLRDAARMEITVAGVDAEAWGNGKLVGDDNASYLHDGSLDVLDVGRGESRRWRDGAAAFAVYAFRLIDRHGGCRYPLGIHLKTCDHAGKRNPLTREASPGACGPARALGMETQVTDHNLAAKVGAGGTAMNDGQWRMAA